jgi:hypothetical protein
MILIFSLRKLSNKAQNVSYKFIIPASPSFCPHLWFVSLIWREIITIETIASINLQNFTLGLEAGK